MNPLELKLKDNSPISDAVSDDIDIEKATALCQNIQKQINTADCFLVDLLEDLNRKEDKPPQIFQYRENSKGGFSLSTGNYIGQFELHKDGGVERVVIGARGPGFPDSKAERDIQGRFLLDAMLDACWDLPLLFLEIEAEEEPWDYYDALLAVRLAAQLDRACRKGPLRVYRTFQRRDSRVQGRLDIPREIRQGMGLQDGRIAYEVREYTEDNDYNSLFFLACQEAERQYPSLMLHMRKKLPGYNTACQALQSTSWGRLDVNALLGRTQKKITNPIYRDYETLRGISRAFLRRQGYYSRTSGSGTPFVTGVFLDLSVLWERYLLKKVLPPSAERHYQLEDHILGGNMLVRPDFLWREEHVVLDAKYRFVWGDTLDGKWTGPLHDDVYQVLTYMLELGCTRGGVLFPVDQKRKAKQQENQELKIPINSISGSFWRFPFGVPDEISDYSAFCRSMDQEAEQLAGQIGKLFGAEPSEPRYNALGVR